MRHYDCHLLDIRQQTRLQRPHMCMHTAMAIKINKKRRVLPLIHRQKQNSVSENAFTYRSIRNRIESPSHPLTSMLE